MIFPKHAQNAPTKVHLGNVSPLKTAKNAAFSGPEQQQNEAAEIAHRHKLLSCRNVLSTKCYWLFSQLGLSATKPFMAGCAVWANVDALH